MCSQHAQLIELPGVDHRAGVSTGECEVVGGRMTGLRSES
jgi:hypothetical protein